MRIIPGGFRALLMMALLGLSAAATAAEKDKTFSEAELDQMMAPIALYPDSLLSQILMASTYPADVAEAVKWSKGHPEQKGDAAVTAVQEKSWDPSVMSLVAFPQVLEMMGKQPDWVQNVGDAFLADPEGAMDTVQKLRKKARDEGNLASTDQQKVIVEEASSDQSVIVIEPVDPQVVYVPVYNPTVIYGTWWWPHYTPYYYYPVGYGFTAGVVTGIGFGVGIAITNSLWGNCNWGHHDIDIDINKHNNININNNKIDINNRTTTWNHNPENRRGVPYRDQTSRDKFSKKAGGVDQRKDYRGRDAERDKARATLKERGADPAQGRKELAGAGGDKVRDSVKQADRDIAAGKLSQRDAGQARDAARNLNRDSSQALNASGRQSATRDNALRGAGNAGMASRNFDRGNSSMRSMQSRGGGGGFRSGGGGLRGR